jgi:trigger factor
LSNLTNQTETVTTKNLSVIVTRQPGCHIKLEVSVTPEGIQACYAKAVKNIGKEVSIPGFRRGKAPVSLLEERFSRQIDAEWREVLANTAVHEFFDSSKLYPFAKKGQSFKRIEIVKISKESGGELIYEYEAAPEVPEVDVASIRLNPVERVSITEQDVQSTLHQIQLSKSQVAPVTDRPIQEGDLVDLDIEVVDHMPRSICKDARFDVSQGHIGAWLHKLLIGRSLDETVEGMSEKDDSISAGIEFKESLCRVTVKRICTADRPPIDDHLAKTVGVDSLPALRDKIHKQLERNAEEEMRNELRGQAEAALLEKYKFDVPASLIEEQYREISNQKIRDLKKHEHSKEHLETMREEIGTSVREELNRAYRLYFLAQRIAQEHQIAVYQKELMEEAVLQARFPEGRELFKENANVDEVRSKLFVNVLSKKVLDLIISKASFTPIAIE